MPHVEAFKDILVSSLQKVGVVPGSDTPAADSSRSRQGFTDGEGELEDLIFDKETAGNVAREIFNIHDFGAEGEWKKLDGKRIPETIHTKFACSRKRNKNESWWNYVQPWFNIPSRLWPMGFHSHMIFLSLSLDSGLCDRVGSYRLPFLCSSLKKTETESNLC